jgi:hypothetical protein
MGENAVTVGMVVRASRAACFLMRPISLLIHLINLRWPNHELRSNQISARGRRYRTAAMTHQTWLFKTECFLIYKKEARMCSHYGQ